MLEHVHKHLASADERSFFCDLYPSDLSTPRHTTEYKQGYPPEREGWSLPRLQNDGCRPRPVASPECPMKIMVDMSGPIGKRARTEGPVAPMIGPLGEAPRCLADNGAVPPAQQEIVISPGLVQWVQGETEAEGELPLPPIGVLEEHDSPGLNPRRLQTKPSLQRSLVSVLRLANYQRQPGHRRRTIASGGSRHVNSL